MIGLHPASSDHTAPGTAGGIGYGLETYEPAEDGNPIYLWEPRPMSARAAASR